MKAILKSVLVSSQEVPLQTVQRGQFAADPQNLKEEKEMVYCIPIVECNSPFPSCS